MREDQSNGLLKILTALVGIVAALVECLSKIGWLVNVDSTHVFVAVCLALIVYFIFDIASWYEYIWSAVVPGIAAVGVTFYWLLVYRTLNQAKNGPKLPVNLAISLDWSWVAALLLTAWIVWELIDNTDNGRRGGNRYTDSTESKAAALIVLFTVWTLVFFF